MSEVLRLAPLETLGVMPKVGASGAKMTTVNQKPQLDHDRYYKELQRLLKQLAAQQGLVGTGTGNSARGLQRGETAEAQVVLAAQQRLVDAKRSDHTRQELSEQRANSRREINGNAQFRRRATI
jgi:hypothetical protein